MQKTRVLIVMLVLLAGLFLVSESRRAPLNSVDERFADWLGAHSARAVPPAAITLIEINDSSLADEHAWPWSPLDYTLFLPAAMHFNPAVIAIEPVLQWEPWKMDLQEQVKHVQYERMLQDFLRRTPKILLAAQLGFPNDPDVIPPLQEVPQIRHVTGNFRNVPEFTEVERQATEELRLGAVTGFSNIPPEENRIRKIPLVFRYRGQIVPSFALQAVILWSQLTPDDVRVRLGVEIALGEKIRIPIDETGAMRVDFRSPMRRFGFDDLLLAVEQLQSGQEPVVRIDSLAGKIVMLARTDAAARTLYFASGRPGSPGELTAAAIATIQNGTFIRKAPFHVNLLIIGGFMLLSWNLLRWTLSRLLMIAAFIALIYLLGSLVFFGITLMALPLLLPAGLLLMLIAVRAFSGAKETSPGLT